MEKMKVVAVEVLINRIKYLRPCIEVHDLSNLEGDLSFVSLMNTYPLEDLLKDWWLFLMTGCSIEFGVLLERQSTVEVTFKVRQQR